MSRAVESFDALTGLRGVAALWVALFHAAATVFPGLHLPPVVSRLIGSGWLAVDLFFVLSGFIMAHVHLRDFAGLEPQPIRGFLKLRIARVYPAHLAAMLCWLPILAYAAWRAPGSLSEGVSASYNPQTFAYGVLLLNGWGLPHSQGWNLPSWSVGSEWFAYLCFPFVALGLHRVPGVVANLVIGLAILAACVVLAIVVNKGRQYMLPESFTLVRVVSEFAMGICTYRIFSALRGRASLAWLAPASICVALMLAALPHHPMLDAVFILSFACTVLGLAFGAAGPTGILAGPMLTYLGRISYSLYLIHALVIVIFRQVMSPFGELGQGASFAAAALFLFAATAAGALLYVLIEEPMRGYLRSVWIMKRRTGAVAQIESSVA
jgi:peptidoglycan/LPS O-acetylase OafA/YrhL